MWGSRIDRCAPGVAALGFGARPPALFVRSSGVDIVEGRVIPPSLTFLGRAIPEKNSNFYCFTQLLPGVLLAHLPFPCPSQ